MMALESSVLGCGSDDWSVDSDYAFQDFTDDARQHTKRLQPTSTPERAHRVAGMVPSVRSVIPDAEPENPENEVEREGHHVYHDTETGAAAPDGKKTRPVPEQEMLCGSKGNGVGSGRDDQTPYVSEARLFGDPGSSTDSAHILRLEQRMFLKAAFQLLEERDRLLPASIASGSSNWAGAGWGAGDGDGHANGNEGTVGVLAGNSGSAGIGRGFQEYGLNMHIIRSGTLRKATARSVGRLEKTTWKTKYIDLTPGRFAYADGPSVLGKSRNAKVIPLYLGFCTCRSVKKKKLSTSSNPPSLTARSGVDDGVGVGGGGAVGASREGGTGGGTGGRTKKHLLEIEVVGLKRRVWAAESKQERRRWVSAIKAAMTERPVDPTETAMGENQLPTIPHDSCHRDHMESYLTARASLRTASTIEGYLSALEGLRQAVREGGKVGREREENPLGVPVKWVKQQLPGAERIYQVSARHRGKSELAQLWKDMKRDTVSINGRVLKGERGPEAIVGALTRCILAHAGRLPASDSLSKLSEAQSLLAARDVLLACDRTTSGGDTYLVVDNLCRNPDLVVLVPASQEAEPLDIQVTLHPRGQAQTPDLFRDGGRSDCFAAATPPPELPTPPSPSSLGDRSPSASPARARDPRPESTRARSPDVVTASCDGGAKTPGRRRPTLPNDGGNAARLQQPASAPGTRDAAGSKRRGRLSLSARRPRITRNDSATGGRVGQTAPAPDPRSFSSWDSLQDMLPKTTAGQISAQRGPTSPIAGREPPSTSRGRPLGGGVFASLARRRSGDASQGARSRGGSSTSTTPNLQTPLSAREVSRGRGGGGEGWRGSNTASPQSVSRTFFVEDADDGGQESGSSSEEDDGDGPPSRRSYIRVACTARTSYKLFSSNPQDEERDVFAVVTGLFEQAFTISKELPPGSGGRTSSGMGNATKTEGSVAFLTFHKPFAKRESIDRTPSAIAAAAAEGAALPAPRVDARGCEKEEHYALSNGNGRTAGGVNSYVSLSFNAASAFGESREANHTEASASTADDVNGNLSSHRAKPTQMAAAGRARTDNRNRQNDAKYIWTDTGNGDLHPSHDGDAGVANDDSEIGRFTGTATLTPESVVPVPCSPPSTVTRSRTGSGVKCSPSPAAGGFGGIKGSPVAGLQYGTADAADAFRLEPLKLFSDEDEAYVEGTSNEA